MSDTLQAHFSIIICPHTHAPTLNDVAVVFRFQLQFVVVPKLTPLLYAFRLFQLYTNVSNKKSSFVPIAVVPPLLLQLQFMIAFQL